MDGLTACHKVTWICLWHIGAMRVSSWPCALQLILFLGGPARKVVFRKWLLHSQLSGLSLPFFFYPPLFGTPNLCTELLQASCKESFRDGCGPPEECGRAVRRREREECSPHVALFLSWTKKPAEGDNLSPWERSHVIYCYPSADSTGQGTSSPMLPRSFPLMNALQLAQGHQTRRAANMLYTWTCITDHQEDVHRLTDA